MILINLQLKQIVIVTLKSKHQLPKEFSENYVLAVAMAPSHDAHDALLMCMPFGGVC